MDENRKSSGPPPVLNYKKKPGNCNYIVIFGEHYNKIIWEEHAAKIQMAKPIYNTSDIDI